MALRVRACVGSTLEVRLGYRDGHGISSLVYCSTTNSTLAEIPRLGLPERCETILLCPSSNKREIKVVEGAWIYYVLQKQAKTIGVVDQL